MVGTINVSPAEERGRERGEGGWFRLQKNVLGVVVADHMHRISYSGPEPQLSLWGLAAVGHVLAGDLAAMAASHSK